MSEKRCVQPCDEKSEKEIYVGKKMTIKEAMFIAIRQLEDRGDKCIFGNNKYKNAASILKDGISITENGIFARNEDLKNFLSSLGDEFPECTKINDICRFFNGGKCMGNFVCDRITPSQH